MADEYLLKVLVLLKDCTNNNEILDVIDGVYRDGFEDGINSGALEVEDETNN
jgi:hypothetical protein